jgi:outer membrane protein TolC
MRKGKIFLSFAMMMIPILLIGKGLELSEAEAIAMENNLQLQLADEALQKAEVSLRDAIGAVLPTISAYGQFTKNHELPVIVIDFDGPGPAPATAIPMGSVYSSTGGLSLTQPLFTGGMVYSGYKIAREGVRLAELSKDQRQMEIIKTIRTLYYQLGLLSSLEKATERSLESARLNYETVLKKQNVGKANQFEALQAQVSYESLRPQLINLKNQKQIMLTNFNTFLNVPADKRFDSVNELIQEENPYQDKSLAELKSMAVENRLELKLLKSQKDIALNQKRIAVGQALPMLSLSADLRHQAQADKTEDLDYYRSRSTSLALSVPLFNGGRKLAGIQKAKISEKELALQLRQMELLIEADVESAYLMLQESVMKIESNSRVVEQAAEALRLARLMYENGSVTQLDVLNSESGWLQAQSAYLSSIFEFNVALNNLKSAINQL